MNTQTHLALIDGETADTIGFYRSWTEVDAVLRGDLAERGPESVRGLILLIGDEDGPRTTIAGDELVRYAESLVRDPSCSPLLRGALGAGSD